MADVTYEDYLDSLSAQSSLAGTDEFVVKTPAGFAKRCLISKIPVASLTGIDTDGTLAANSDSKVATQKAVKTYADAISTAAAAAYQPLDADLTAIAALSTASFGRSVLTRADAAALRTLAGLVIGADVQAYDSDLTDWAGKSAPSGAAVGTTDTQTLSDKRINPRVVALTDAATVTPNADTTDMGTLATLSQATALATPTGTPVNGQVLRLRIKSTAARVITPGSGYRGSTDLAFATFTTSGSSLTDYLIFIYNSADSKWDLVAKTAGF